MSLTDLKGNFAIFYILAKYVPGDIKYIFTKFYRHISTNNEANHKFVILILIFQRLLDLNYSPLSALNEANLTSATQTLNFNPTMHF
jgi:hypothetical protein